MKILMLGNSPKVHGGITSVISQILKYDWNNNNNISIDFISTYEGGNNIHKIIYFYKQYKLIRKYIKNNKVDYVHMHISHYGSFHRANFLLKYFERKKIKTIVHLHSSEFKVFYNSSSRYFQKKISLFFEKANIVITLGEQWKDYIKSISPKANAIILNNSVDNPKKEVKQEKNKISFLYMGVLVKRKGVIDLLKAIDMINKTNASDLQNVVFNIAGDGEEKINLENFVKENHLNEYVNFLGWIDDKTKEETYLKNDIMILPSYNEGLPMCILEAMSYGMPIITTNVGSIKEAVINEQNGFIFEPGEIEKMANYITSCISNYNLRVKMSKESKNIFLKKFDSNKFYSKLKEIYLRGD